MAERDTMVPPTVPEPLWTFLYGRRRHRRHDVGCEAVLHGPARPLACHIVDVFTGADHVIVQMAADGEIAYQLVSLSV